MPPSTLRIHHLSDVHFGPTHFRPTQQIQVAPETARNAQAYLAFLNGLNPPDFPDLIVISGDLMTFASETEMQDSSDFISSITRSPGWHARKPGLAAAPRVLIVPGNHDVDWSKDKPADKHRRFGTIADNVRQNGIVASSHYNYADAAAAIDLGDECNLFFYLLNSTYLGGVDNPLLKSVYEQIQRSAAPVAAADLQALGRAIKQDPGYVRSAEIDAMKRASAAVPPGRVRIAVVHHNVNHVPSDNVDSFDTIINAGILKVALLDAGFDIVLHGHRHIFHCSAEFHPSLAPQPRRCYFISANSLGCQSDAPFVELLLANPARAHAAGQPACRFSVREFLYSPGAGYRPNPPVCDELLGSPVPESPAAAAACSPLERVLSHDGPIEDCDKAALHDAVKTLLPKLQSLQSRLTDWADDSEWIKHFHFQLDTYQHLYATALYERPASENPNYHRYLREQFDERLRRLRLRDEKILYYSPVVYEAISRTGWRPNPVLWRDYKLKQSSNPDQLALGVARVVICDGSTLNPSVLLNMDHDHRLFAIPLFLIDRAAVEPEHAVDFAIGLSGNGNPIKACAYDTDKGCVQEQNRYRAWNLIDAFEKLLQNKKLKTVERYLGGQPMNQDPAQAAQAARKYDENRRPSQLILNAIASHLPAGAAAGLDLCCGTGNYTIPFLDRFQRLIGLDTDKAMLAYARRKSSRVQWIEADAKDTTLPDDSCDAVWMISAIHYFRDAEQTLLFKEILRVLRPGGVFFADTEFLEQHPSMWIVEYFPSLRDRFRDSLFTQEQYDALLRAAGFDSVAFQTCDYHPEEGDAFLRIGQHKPELYLDPKIQAAVPALRDMPANELIPGRRRLEEDIAKREIGRVIERYRAKASMPGDLGFIIARKPAG